MRNEYRDRVKSVEDSVEEVVTRRRASRAKHVLDGFLPLALLSLILVFFIGFGVSVSEGMATTINYLNWAVILYFAARLAVGLRLANSKEQYFRNHWMDFVLVVPAFSLLREVKLFQAVAELEMFNIEAETVAGSALLSRTAGVAAKISRIVRILWRSLVG